MAITLFERFPGTATVPVAGIASLPTPLMPFSPDISGLERLAALRIKRDDLTSALYGGNKVRKLDFIFGQALAEGRTTVLTFGAYGSNHCLATAVHARRLGIEPHVVLSPQEHGPYAPATLLAHAGLGTVIHLVDGWDGRREAVRAVQALRERDGAEPLVIPMGGSNALSTLGHVNAALEALEQGPAPDVVYVAGGTEGTSVGLAVGLAATGVATRVESIRVTPEEVGGRAQVERITANALAFLRGLDPSFPALEAGDLRFTLREDWFEPGYGIVTPETSAAVSAAASAGVALETTYSGKALAALAGDAATGTLDGKDVLFWDTYNSAPLPEPGPIEALPQALRDYIEECWRLFPDTRPS